MAFFRHIEDRYGSLRRKKDGGKLKRNAMVAITVHHDGSGGFTFYNAAGKKAGSVSFNAVDLVGLRDALNKEEGLDAAALPLARAHAQAKAQEQSA